LNAISQEWTFSHTTQLWIESLKQIISEEIALDISIDDFKNTFVQNRNKLHLPRLGITLGIIGQCLNVFAVTRSLSHKPSFL
jgi:hypothetical protein